MKKKFESRFKSNAKFILSIEDMKLIASNHLMRDKNYIDLSFVPSAIFKKGFCWAKTSEDGSTFYLFSLKPLGFEKVVSKYIAAPELIPDGMRYNKELDKLVPDITPADEYTQGIKVEFEKVGKDEKANHRAYNIGSSNYAAMNIQPWDIWKDWRLDPWDADIIKRISRTKQIPGKTFNEARIEDYEKIKHICDEKILQLKEKK